MHRSAQPQALLPAKAFKPGETYDWVLVTRNKALLANTVLAGKTSAIDEIPGLNLWTDDFSSLYQILK